MPKHNFSIVSVIIVNYHSQDYIYECIRTMQLYHDMQRLEVIVVNNAGNLKKVKKEFDFVKIVDSPNNMGFSAANNIGFREASGDIVLYLNPDTYFISQAIHTCAEILRKDSSIGLLGCRLLNEDRSLQLSYHDGDQVFRKLINRNPFVIKFFNGNRKAMMSIEIIQLKHNSDHEARWLTGAYAMFRKSDIREKGLLWDEDFFMYWEDVELSYRIKKKGLKCFYTTNAELIHMGGSGENVSFTRFDLMEKSKLLFLEKTNGKFHNCIYVKLVKWTLRLENFLNRRKNINPSKLLSMETEFYLKKKLNNGIMEKNL